MTLLGTCSDKAPVGLDMRDQLLSPSAVTSLNNVVCVAMVRLQGAAQSGTANVRMFPLPEG